MNKMIGRVSGAGAVRRVGIGVGIAAIAMFATVPVWAQQDGGGDGAPPPPQQGAGGQQGGGPGGFGGPGGGFGGGPGGFGGGRQGGGPGIGMGRPGGNQGPVSLARAPFDYLASALKLSPDQSGKVAIVLIEARDTDQSMRPAQGPGGGGPGGPGGGGFGGGDAAGAAGGGTGSRAKQREFETTVQTQVEALLSDSQKARVPNALGALTALQSVGVPAFAANKLYLTDKQIDDLAALAPKRQNRQEDPDSEAARKSRAAIKAVLNTDQVAQVTTYMNRAKTAQRGMGGGPGGFGGGAQGGPDGGPGGGPGGFGGAQGGPGGPGGGPEGDGGGNPPPPGQNTGAE